VKCTGAEQWLLPETLIKTEQNLQNNCNMTTRKPKMTLNPTLLFAIVVSMLTVGVTSCKQITQDKQDSAMIPAETVFISEQEVLDAQTAWGEGILKIILHDSHMPYKS
jgi:hypothetical protein